MTTIDTRLPLRGEINAQKKGEKKVPAPTTRLHDLVHHYDRGGYSLLVPILARATYVAEASEPDFLRRTMVAFHFVHLAEL
jgi:hypothetical protein